MPCLLFNGHTFVTSELHAEGHTAVPAHQLESTVVMRLNNDHETLSGPIANEYNYRLWSTHPSLRSGSKHHWRGRRLVEVVKKEKKNTSLAYLINNGFGLIWGLDLYMTRTRLSHPTVAIDKIVVDVSAPLVYFYWGNTKWFNHTITIS